MKGGEIEMFSAVNDRLRLVNEMRAAQMREAANSRRDAKPAVSIRRALGTRIVRFGTRLAGEPTYSLARSR
ncbi:MAG TPA: hypothetical protein VFK35_13565 [Candidatus Limnocylindrales bacterium]|nr:hypothetical protein [Candidatus Limnocylindrales bacterium]